jgi:hypothetical protein
MDKRKLKKLHLVSDQVVASYESGMSLTELGGYYKVSPSTVASLLKELNVSRRRKGPRGKDAGNKT